MNLQKKYILFTFFIICTSVFIGFIFSNIIYFAFVKEQMTNQYLEVANQLVKQIEDHEQNWQAATDFLETISHLGYQIALVKKDGEIVFFGEPFRQTELNEQMLALFDGENVYQGVKSFKHSYLMVSHFKNDIENTVGTKLTLEGEELALFLRSNHFFTDFHLIIFGFIIAVFISSVIGILFISRKLTQLFTQLTNATEEIANNNYEYPLTIYRKDEIGRLADSFRMMQKKLANTEKARKKFISNVSHDFQTPLLNIQGYSELLDRENLSNEGKKYNQIIQTEAKRLSKLTKQLLILTSIDQGTYPMSKQFVRIDEQLQQVVYSLLWRVEEKGLEVKFDLEPVSVYADRSLLVMVWENLIGNAIKYNKEYGEISIQCFKEKSKIIVKIKDTGVGIDKEALEKIFDRFYRTDKARNKDGMGLGLSIVQEVLYYHHASIEVESEVGKGTTFTIVFESD